LQALKGTGVIKTNTLLRVVCTLAVSLILSGAAHAQSVLNFARTTVNERSDARVTVTNPTSNYTDVQFTFYGLDGNPVSSGLGVNPVRYRVAPRGQVSMTATDMFAGFQADGWIQATSASSGLLGFYTSGDVSSTLEGSEASLAYTSQLIPVIREDQNNSTELVVLNPGTAPGNVTITIFNPRGEEVGNAVRGLSPHAAVRLPVSGLITSFATGNLSARISSSVPVSATAIIERDAATLFAGGQPVDQPASVRVAPHFITGNGYDSVLFLANPTASQVSVTVTLFNETGGPAPSRTPRTFPIPGNGSVSVAASDLAGAPIAPLVSNGWLRIESSSTALNGMVILDQGQALTGVPLQTIALDRLLYSQISDVDNLSTGLALINSSATAAALTVSLVDSDGTTFAQSAFPIPANSKRSAMLRDIVSQAAGRNQGYVFIRSTVPLWSFGVLSARNARDFLAAMPPASRVPDRFAPNALAAVPAVTVIEPGLNVQSGATLRVSVAGLSGEPLFSIGGQMVPHRALAPGGSAFTVIVPAVEPGLVKLRVRSGGVESAPLALRISPPDNLPMQTISGQAFYQKFDVTDAGLDLNRPVMFPIRNSRVEVFDRGTMVAVSDTDLDGRFQVPVPMSASVVVRVVSRLRSSGESRVADNTNLNALYAVSSEIDAREAVGNVLLIDNSRVSGAFNILEMIQRSNDLVRLADANIVPPSVTIFWSTRNSLRTVGTTYFNVTNNTAYVLGNRNSEADESDEYDDSVIIHEYAHALAVRFSRDDSPGGSHGLGDVLDPRVAWSEGWANFFACAVRNDPIFRDAGPSGLTLRYDLEDNLPVGDNRPGYWSEASIGTLLWDLFDDHVDPEDALQYPFSQIWGAFSELRNNRFVYLPYFLEHFLARTQGGMEALRTMVQLRSIDFQPNVRPSVTSPFPRIVDVGETVTGSVDSLSSRRNNLMQSAHFLAFTTAGGNASIRLDITGAGSAGNPNANDLDLFLVDANGRVLERSDRGLNGQSELISMRLDAGTYVLEIRSYYTKAETGGLVFNSGDYRLSVLVQ
jgi:hypothetical protein